MAGRRLIAQFSGKVVGAFSPVAEGDLSIPVGDRIWPLSGSLRFHLQMTAVAAALIVVSAFGCALVGIDLQPLAAVLKSDGPEFAVFIFVYLALRLIRDTVVSDSILIVFWSLVVPGLLRFPVAIAVRLGARFPLVDAPLLHFDRAFGINVPAIAEWATHSRFGLMENGVYTWLGPILGLSVLLPILFGKRFAARRFIWANIIAFAIALPVFILFPCIGPWYAVQSHFATPIQAQVEQSILLCRGAGDRFLINAPWICFPSFHVMWAAISCATLCQFRWLRVPAIIVCSLLAVSTVTTGWHYFVDVLGGLLLAYLSLSIATRLVAAEGE